MKKILSFSLIAFSVLLTSCFKPQQPEKININYYICGNINSDTPANDPVIYKNGVISHLSTSGEYCFVSDMCINGGDIYAAGYSIDENGDMYFKFWKNGESHLPLLRAKGEISKITFNDSKMYAVGTIDKEGVSHGVILEDGNPIYECQDEDSHFNLFGTNGNFFLVAGTVGLEGVYWIISKENEKYAAEKVSVLKKEGFQYIPSDITGTYNTPVISWNETNMEDSSSRGCFTVGKSNTMLKEENSHINSIYVYNGFYNSAGYIRKESETKAYTWAGTEANEYGRSLSGNSYVFKTVFDGSSVHMVTVAESENNIYFDVSGMIGYGTFKMKYDQGFTPSSIFITYTKDSNGAVEI